ncbi:acyltransferase family protein [Streptomyces sp. NPDC005438]|uniref:acyltransferase family protein n=1 Tax=Streptomyces sp. NPDC005438 TaxID=3156880 RepID=UPI0033A79E8C
MTAQLTETTRVPARRSRGLGATAISSRATRDPFFDNAKFLLVILVVVGHNWAPFAQSSRVAEALYLTLYAFHMPAFVLICGYFSRSFTGRPDQLVRLVSGVLLPYLAFEVLYSAAYVVVMDRPFAVTPTVPTYLCWFLLALFLWRLTVPLWRGIRYPVVVAALVSLGAGLTDTGDELALSRVLMFLPWFVLGTRLRPELLRPLRTPLARWLALVVMPSALVGAYWLAPRLSAGWLLMTYDHRELNTAVPGYLLTRLAIFAVGAVLVAAFLALVPRRRTAFTALGAVTLYPYLLHGLLVKTVQGCGGYDTMVGGGLPVLALSTLGAVALGVLLCAVPVRRLVRPLVEPSLPRWLVTGEGRGTSREARGERVRELTDSRRGGSA